jgi:hypothetical protein
MIGVDHRGLVKKIQNLIPEYMVMGERGMADMGEMEMPIPEQTLPMMTGTGPYGAVEMGGMFSMLKVRKDQKPGDYKNPGWFKQPTGTQAFEWTGTLPEPARFKSESPANNGLVTGLHNPATGFAADKPIELKIRKPAGHSGH